MFTNSNAIEELLLHFDHKGKMREMSRKDFHKAQSDCTTAGLNIMTEYKFLAPFRLKLLHTPEEFFSSTLTATDPVFLVIGRD